MSNDAVLQALKAALDQDPKNVALWSHYASLLVDAGRTPDALSAYRSALTLEPQNVDCLLRALPLLRELGELSEAIIRVEQALEVHGGEPLKLEHVRILLARGDQPAARDVLGSLPTSSVPADLTSVLTGDASAADSDATVAEVTAPEASADSPPEDPTPTEESSPPEASPPELIEITHESENDEDVEEWASQFDWGDLHLTFDDVAGLDDVKRQLRLRIIEPLKRPEMFEAFNRTAGGGVLLYGPPGCGKTFIAKATAGECKARFVSIGIHEIVDKYWGESEKMIHALFEEARRQAPTVLFFDEFDALGGVRGSSESQFWKTMVNQLLQEMDGVGGRNDQVLVFAATNLPWNVDSAFRRPGRFDRSFFVPPPDAAGRVSIIEAHIKKLPGGGTIKQKDIAKRTRLLTGADLRALCERSAEHALERSLDSGNVEPVTMADFERELGKMTSSALEWLETAKNYARYSNQGGQYDELTEFLKKVKRW